MKITLECKQTNELIIIRGRIHASDNDDNDSNNDDDDDDVGYNNDNNTNGTYCTGPGLYYVRVMSAGWSHQGKL